MSAFTPSRFWLVACAFLLAGCSNFPTALKHGGNPFTQPANYDKALALPSSQATFKDALVAEYQSLATKEGKVWYDWFDSDFFSRKALDTAASEKGLLPEDPAMWRFSKEKIAALQEARNGLLKALETARTTHPVHAARAQGRFDCWIEEEEEKWQTDLIALCKKEYEAALAELKTEMVVDPGPQKATLYTVFFDFDDATVTPIGTQVLQALAEDWGSSNAALNLVGHADRAGSVVYNKRLSERRALSVLKVLDGLGLSSSRMTTSGVGESAPAVSTADGVREPRNRRVVIEVQ